MRFNVVLRYVGMITMLTAVFMLLSALVSLAAGMDSGFYPLLLSAFLTAALGLFPLLFVRRTEQINTKEGYMIVVGAWLMACCVGMFPYLLWGGEFTLSNAWFESVSGFTTTGATCLNNIEALPKGLLFWRSATHWLGGIGVVMFVLVIIPTLGKTKMALYSVELSPLAKENYNYRSHKLIRILLSLYVGMTLCETLLLRVAGMNWFDAVNHAFSTLASGGFSTRNASIAYYDNVWIEIIIMFFMVLAGLHFGLIFATLTGKRDNIFRSGVARFYLTTILAAGLIISINIWSSGVYTDIWEAVRYGYFQTISIITTTGFATANTTLWTPLAIVLLLYLMFQCGCAGSTSGGIKSDRIWLAVNVIKARILQQQHPNAIVRVKMNGTVQDEALVNYAMLYIVIYLMITTLGTIVVAATGIDLQTSFSMAAASMGNVGPGFGDVGSFDNYAQMSPFVQTTCTVMMLLGRLEIFGLIQIFVIKWWK